MRHVLKNIEAEIGCKWGEIIPHVLIQGLTALFSMYQVRLDLPKNTNSLTQGQDGVFFLYQSFTAEPGRWKPRNIAKLAKSTEVNAALTLTISRTPEARLVLLV